MNVRSLYPVVELTINSVMGREKSSIRLAFLTFRKSTQTLIYLLFFSERPRCQTTNRYREIKRFSTFQTQPYASEINMKLAYKRQCGGRIFEFPWNQLICPLIFPKTEKFFRAGWVYPTWYSFDTFGPSHTFLDISDWNHLSSLILTLSLFFFSLPIQAVQKRNRRFGCAERVPRGTHPALKFFPKKPNKTLTIFTNWNPKNRGFQPKDSDPKSLSNSQQKNLLKWRKPMELMNPHN